MGQQSLVMDRNCGRGCSPCGECRGVDWREDRLRRTGHKVETGITQRCEGIFLDLLSLPFRCHGRLNMGEDNHELVPPNKKATRSDEGDAVFSRSTYHKGDEFLRLGLAQRSCYMRSQKTGALRWKDGLGGRVVSKDIIIEKTSLPLDFHGLQDRLKILHREGNGMTVGGRVPSCFIQRAIELHDKNWVLVDRSRKYG